MDHSQLKHVLMNPTEVLLCKARQEKWQSLAPCPNVEMISGDFLKQNYDHSKWGSWTLICSGFHFLLSGHTCKGVYEMTGKTRNQPVTMWGILPSNRDVNLLFL